MAKISARIGTGEKASPSVSVEYDFGANLEAAVAKFGEKVVFTHFLSSATVTLQSRMRAAMKDDVAAGKAPDSKKVNEALKGWKLGEKAPGVDKVEKATTFVAKMSAEERAALLKKLQEAMAA